MDPFALPDIGTIVLLCLAAGLAGWVDAVSGGGGLLQLPALFLALPSAAPVEVLATNKASSILGTAAATATYARKAPPDVRTALPMVIAAVVGAALGAATASRLPAEVFRPVIVVLLVAGVGLDPAQSRRWDGRSSCAGRAAVATTSSRPWPGWPSASTTGSSARAPARSCSSSWWPVLGYSFLNASSTAKVVNLGTNLAAIVVFGVTGSVLWLLGLLMGACNVIGAVVGARMAIRRGSEFVRLVFLAVVGVLILRLGWDLLA